jgi:hypothetical protein
MADQTQLDPVDTPTENITATATGEMPSPKLAKDRETATKKRSTLRLIVLGIVVVVAIAGFFVWRYMNRYEDTDDAQVDGHINNVSARVSGYVLKVNVDDNQNVQKGAVLVEIDPRDYQVAVERAKAELADASSHESECACGDDRNDDAGFLVGGRFAGVPSRCGCGRGAAQFRAGATSGGGSQ